MQHIVSGLPYLLEDERTDWSEGHLRLVTGRPARHVAHAVLPLHLAAVRHLHFEPCVVRKRGKGYQIAFRIRCSIYFLKQCASDIDQHGFNCKDNWGRDSIMI